MFFSFYFLSTHLIQTKFFLVRVAVIHLLALESLFLFIRYFNNFERCIILRMAQWRLRNSFIKFLGKQSNALVGAYSSLDSLNDAVLFSSLRPYWICCCLVSTYKWRNGIKYAKDLPVDSGRDIYVYCWLSETKSTSVVQKEQENQNYLLSAFILG